MNRDSDDRAAVRFPPPLVFAGSVALGFGIQHFLPVPLPVGEAWQSWVGRGLIVAGMILLTIALGLFARTRQNPEPWTPTPSVITTGVYRFTRNPMYLAMALLQTGFGVGFDSLWVLMLTPVSMLLVNRIAIEPEERYLAKKFGEDYVVYCARVRRWL